MANQSRHFYIVDSDGEKVGRGRYYSDSESSSDYSSSDSDSSYSSGGESSGDESDSDCGSDTEYYTTDSESRSDYDSSGGESSDEEPEVEEVKPKRNRRPKKQLKIKD